MLLIFVLIQFYPRPKKNISSPQSSNSIEQLYPIQDSILQVLKAACYDCHSNNTNYPWYSNIQPIAWFLNRHIVEGKKELNLDEFGTYSKRRRQSKLKAIFNQVKDGEMPLTSYLLMHKKARLSDKESNMIIKWFKERSEMSNN